MYEPKRYNSTTQNGIIVSLGKSFGTTHLLIEQYQAEINAKEQELVDLRRQRDNLIVECLDNKDSYSLMQRLTGMARSSIIKIKNRGQLL